jgi:sensor domain CHASE-containing protein
VSSLFYINEEALLSLVKLYSPKEEIKLTEAREMLQDIFDELSPNPKIFEQFEIKFEEQEPGDGYETCAKLLDIYGDEIYSTEQ